MSHANRLLLLILAIAVAPTAVAKPRDAESWVSLTVAPALVQELAVHPRFKGETIRVVVFADDRPAARSNAFALSLRDRLAGAIFDTPGIRMAAERNHGQRLDCTLNEDEAESYRNDMLSSECTEFNDSFWLAAGDDLWDC